MTKRLSAFVFIALFLTFALVGPFNPTAPTPVFAQDTCDVANSVLISTLIYGVNCLDANGFNAVEIGADYPASSVDDVAVCPDTGTVWAMHLFGITEFNGSTSTDLDLPGEEYEFSPYGIACGAGGQLWVAHSDGVALYDGAAWTLYPMSDFGSVSYSVDDIQIAPDGTVWANAYTYVARLVNGAWEVFDDSNGFGEEYYLGEMALTADGLPVLSHFNGFIGFDGSAWYKSPDAPLFGLDPIAVDADGKIWLGSITEGLAIYDGSGWQQVNMNDGLSSNTVHTLAFDASGRLWVGTEYGLSVLDGDVWTNYLQSNAGLLDNEVRFVAPVGVPALPAALEKAPGTVTGTVVLGRDPVPNARVELCTETVGGTFYEDTPCADYPNSLMTTTDAEGNFTFENVPVGRYDITVEAPDGWVYFTGMANEVDVRESGAVDLGFVDVAQ